MVEQHLGIGIAGQEMFGDIGEIECCTFVPRDGGKVVALSDDESMELENRIAMGRRFATSFDAEALGPHSGYTCPDCDGSLMSVSENNYRCRVGHAWTADALLKARDGEIESARMPWVANSRATPMVIETTAPLAAA